MSVVSSSPAASRLAQEVLRDLFSMEPMTLKQEKEDKLNQSVGFPMFRRSWDSVASKCPSSGTVLHFLSLTSDSDTLDNDATSNHISLLGITDSKGNNQDDNAIVQESRQWLASHICGENDARTLAKSLGLLVNHASGRNISASHLTRLKGGLPLMSLPSSSNSNEESLQSLQTGALKEIAIPFDDGCCYPNGQSLLSMLSSSTLNRPTVGLYQWPNNGIALRPLPSAEEDRTLPVPSLVFFCKDLDSVAGQVSAVGAVSAKIGYNGLAESGQLMVSHPMLYGLDLRVTDCVEFTSAFPEAQEALLASSLGELQNANVLVKGGKENDVANRSTVDNRDNQGDCWVEFRANMKRPSGFIKRSTRGKSGKVRTAKAPDLPYE